MKHPFKANTFDTVAKEITVTSLRSELKIEIDYDDVDHRTVKREAKKMIALLNKHWDDDLAKTVANEITGHTSSATVAPPPPISISTMMDLFKQVQSLRRPYVGLVVSALAADYLRREMPQHAPARFPITGFYGIAVHEKIAQRRPAWQFNDRELLDKYLLGDITEDYLETLATT